MPTTVQEPRAPTQAGTTAAPPIGAPTAPPPMLLSAETLARELDVSTRTIRRLDLEGKLPRPVKIGHAVRWPRSVIEAWVANGCKPRNQL